MADELRKAEDFEADNEPEEGEGLEAYNTRSKCSEPLSLIYCYRWW